MKLYAECTHCENEVEFRLKAGTRIELLRKVGEDFELTCDYCGQKFEQHVDQIYAKRSKFLRLLAILIFLVGTPAVGFAVNPTVLNNINAVYVYGLFLTIPVAIYGLIIQQDQRRVSDFNRNKVRGHISSIG